ncbi:MAG: hypothetical protein AAGJ10_02390 [Bacteroidota bacterium]
MPITCHPIPMPDAVPRKPEPKPPPSPAEPHRSIAAAEIASLRAMHQRTDTALPDEQTPPAPPSTT